MDPGYDYQSRLPVMIADQDYQNKTNLAYLVIHFLFAEASSWDYVQKIKNNPEHIFTKFLRFTS